MSDAGRPELAVTPQWRKTGNPYFPTAAQVQGHWWVLRVNSFPDHPLWTLFVDGGRRFDVEEEPRAWGHPADRAWPRLAEGQVREALAGLTDFVAYGSEVGRPCDNLFCCG